MANLLQHVPWYFIFASHFLSYTCSVSTLKQSCPTSKWLWATCPTLHTSKHHTVQEPWAPQAAHCMHVWATLPPHCTTPAVPCSAPAVPCLTFIPLHAHLWQCVAQMLPAAVSPGTAGCIVPSCPLGQAHAAETRGGRRNLRNPTATSARGISAVVSGWSLGTTCYNPSLLHIVHGKPVGQPCFEKRTFSC